MNGSRHGRDCTWEYRPPRGLRGDQGAKPKIKSLGLKLRPYGWSPICDSKIGRLELVKGNF